MLSKPGGPSLVCSIHYCSWPCADYCPLPAAAELQKYDFLLYFRAMEFRIAPMILVVFNLIFITLANPVFNSWIPLKDLAQLPQVLIPFALIFVLSVGTYFRHSYYSTTFKVFYFLFQLLNMALLVYYILTIKGEHL